MAQARKAQKKSNLKPFYLVLGILAVAGVAALGWVVVKGQSAKAALEPVEVEGASDPQALVAKAKGVAAGNDGAPVKMLVFSDFQCPYCGQFASSIEPVLVNEFVQSGKLQLVYYDYPLGGAHKYSFLASRAARCAEEQGKFWDYHNLLFGKQSDWSFSSDAPVKKFVEYGTEIGLERGKFESCVKSNQYQDLVSANHVLGERLGVNSTPTIFINGKRVPVDMGLDLKGLRDMINAEAGTAAPPAATTTAQ